MKDQVMGMGLENQVTSLELSKELEKLGVKQDSLWYWVEHYESGTNKRIWSLYQNDEDDIVNKHISAFTVAEHGEALPGEIFVVGTKYYLNMGKIDSQSFFYVRYINQDIYDTVRKVNGKTEADARAKMRIMLIKDKLMEA